MSNEDRSAAPGLSRPLCRRYTLAIFDAAAVRLRDTQRVVERRAHWAFGWLADEECEFLGAWMDVSPGLPQMLADLKRRGAGKILTVASAAGAGHVQRGACAVLSDTVVYPFIDEILVLGAAASHARVPPVAERVAERIRASLVRASRRHGSFENEAAVLDFIAGVLQRAERRLDRERSIAKGRPRHDPGARMVPTGI